MGNTYNSFLHLFIGLRLKRDYQTIYDLFLTQFPTFWVERQFWVEKGQLFKEQIRKKLQTDKIISLQSNQ